VQGKSAGLSYAVYADWRNRIPAFEKTAIWKHRELMLTGVADPENLLGFEVSAQLFDLLGTAPAHGRLFRPRDFESGATPVVILSDRVWRKHFSADPAIVNRQILLDRQGFTIVGVMPPSFVFTSPLLQLWTPLDAARAAPDELRRHYSAAARLRPGATVEQAQREFEAIAPSLPRAPGDKDGWIPRVRPYTEHFISEYRRALYVLWGAVGAVLLIACANAANLLLGRASQRRREFAVRASLGAGARHIIASVLAESLLLGIAAAAAGVAFAWTLLPLLARFVPSVGPAGISTTVTPLALAGTAALALVTSLLCTIPSCLDAFRSSLATPLSSSSRSASANRSSTRLRSFLIAAEVALSIVLLIGAGLMIRSLSRLLDVRRLGIETDHVLTARVSSPSQLRKLEETSTYFTRVLDEVRQTPGVRTAAIVTILPMNNLMVTTSFHARGSAKKPDIIHLRSISPDYFRTLGIPMLTGRGFTDTDGANAPLVAIVNEELAQQCWPGENPIGKLVTRTDPPTDRSWYTVVGVVGNTARRALNRPPDPELYRPYRQDVTAARAMTLVVRTLGEPLALGPVLSRGIHGLNPDQPVTEIKTMETWIHEAARQPRLHTFLLEVFAGLALALAATGMFAVLSYLVAQRRQEFGIRSALGATAGNLATLVLRLGMRQVLLGLLFGLAGALGATRLLESQLFETPPADPLVFVAVPAVMLLVATAAMLEPAWRAGRVDPTIALRAE